MNEVSAANASTQNSVNRRERRALTLVLSLAIPVAAAILVCLPNVGPVFRVFSMTSAGNLPTLPVGSHILVSRASYGYSRYSFDDYELPITGRWPALTPRRGDMIAFRLPRNRKFTYVKRVAGLPGERVQMVKGRLSIDGKLVPREPSGKVPGPSFGVRKLVGVYVERPPGGASYRIMEVAGDRGMLDDTPEFVVPPGHVFVLGDNRDNSIDSRVPSQSSGVGFVPVELVVGRVIATF